MSIYYELGVDIARYNDRTREPLEPLQQRVLDTLAYSNKPLTNLLHLVPHDQTIKQENIEHAICTLSHARLLIVWQVFEYESQTDMRPLDPSNFSYDSICAWFFDIPKCAG